MLALPGGKITELHGTLWEGAKALPQSKASVALRFFSLNRCLWDLRGSLWREQREEREQKAPSLGLINYLTKNLQKKEAEEPNK